MMTVKVKILPQKYEFSLEITKEISLEEFLSLILKIKSIAEILPPGMLVIVNGLPANSPNFKIKPGDNVVLLPPIGGGLQPILDMLINV